jgi:hypothetical protein
MLKTQSAKERLDNYYKQNPRECLDFKREDAKAAGSPPVRMKGGK